jgi:hypothetical protein
MASNLERWLHLPCIYSPERCAGDVMLSDVCYAAIDEADTLFKEGFAEDVFKVLKPLTVCGPSKKRLTCYCQDQRWILSIGHNPTGC